MVLIFIKKKNFLEGLKKKYLRDACSEYLKRLKRFGNVQVIELDEYRLSDNPSDREIEKALEIEGNNILKEAKRLSDSYVY